MCPVRAIKCYLNRTMHTRRGGNAYCSELKKERRPRLQQHQVWHGRGVQQSNKGQYVIHPVKQKFTRSCACKIVYFTTLKGFTVPIPYGIHFLMSDPSNTVRMPSGQWTTKEFNCVRQRVWFIGSKPQLVMARLAARIGSINVKSV